MLNTSRVIACIAMVYIPLQAALVWLCETRAGLNRQTGDCRVPLVANLQFKSPLAILATSWGNTEYVQVQKTIKNEQRNSNNYYEDIYNIYTSLQQHSLTTPIDSTH